MCIDWINLNSDKNLLLSILHWNRGYKVCKSVRVYLLFLCQINWLPTCMRIIFSIWPDDIVCGNRSFLINTFRNSTKLFVTIKRWYNCKLPIKLLTALLISTFFSNELQHFPSCLLLRSRLITSLKSYCPRYSAGN